jgi:CspA family cold shock protein
MSLASAELTFLERHVVKTAHTSRNRGFVMNNGTVKKLVSDRGFGFIAAEDGKEYFFHRDGTESFDSLQGGEKVTFQIEPSPKGPRANQVKVVN